MRTRRCFGLGIALLLASGCGSAEDPPSEQVKEPVWQDVLNVLAHGCPNRGCHASEDEFDLNQRYWIQLLSDGTRIDRFGEWAFNQPVVRCREVGEDRLRIVPGSSTDSFLVDALRGQRLCGGKRMPQNGPYLSDAEIAVVASWVDAGAKF